MSDSQTDKINAAATGIAAQLTLEGIIGVQDTYKVITRIAAGLAEFTATNIPAESSPANSNLQFEMVVSELDPDKAVAPPISLIASKLRSGEMKPEDLIVGDKIICAHCGGEYESMRRHLRTHLMTASQYRDYHNLPEDFPMTGKKFSDHRSKLSIAIRAAVAARKEAAEAENKANAD